MGATITSASRLTGPADGGDAGVIAVKIQYDKIRDDDRKHLQQFVRDLESWKGELNA